MSSSLWALLISLARRPTVDASMVSSDNELARASPESFSTTRCHRGRAPPTSSSATSVTSAAPPRSRADDGLSKTEQLRTAEELPDRVLLVPDERLLEQDALFVPALEPAFDDLVQRGRRLALVARDRRRSLADVLDLLGRDVLTPQVLRTGEGNVESDVVSECLVGPGCPPEHSVHAATVLQVKVAADDRGVNALLVEVSG